MSSGGPTLVIVTGPPASGKSTIARELAQHLAIPAFHKDDFKECLADQLPGTGLEWSQQLDRTAYLVLYRVAGTVIKAGGDCLIEANFHPVLSLPQLSEVAEIDGPVRLVSHRV